MGVRTTRPRHRGRVDQRRPRVCTVLSGRCRRFRSGWGSLPVLAQRSKYLTKRNAVTGEQGELVLSAPMPSMPVGFWGDDGSRYRAAYFDSYPGVWRHGDWITVTDRGTCIISGRSDATLNRGGVRIGTAELYEVVESLPEIADSLSFTPRTAAVDLAT